MNTQTHTITWFDKQAFSFEEKRFALMTVYMTAQSCLGGIAAMYALETHNMFSLVLAAMMTMGANAILIAQAPAKWCLGSFYACVAINLILAISNWAMV